MWAQRQLSSGWSQQWRGKVSKFLLGTFSLWVDGAVKGCGLVVSQPMAAYQATLTYDLRQFILLQYASILSTIFLRTLMVLDFSLSIMNDNPIDGFYSCWKSH